MDRATFTRRLEAASNAAVECAREYLTEPLPDAIRYRVRLNQSYDANAEPGVRLYPADSGIERALVLRHCDAETVVETLWREGAVPAWINIAVLGLTAAETLLELVCCGRFESNDSQLYYVQTEWAPFGVKSPTLPAWASSYLDDDDGALKTIRFSVFDRSEAWDRAEIERLAPQAEKVWSLDLRGPLIDDEVVGELPSMPALEILECHHTAIEGPGLAALKRHPKLRLLRMDCPADGLLSLAHLPRMKQLKNLTMHGLPAMDWGFSRLRASLSHCKSLSLAAQGPLWVEGPAPKVSEFSFTGRWLEGIPLLPAKLKSLGVHVDALDDSTLKALCAPVRQVRDVALNGSRVSLAAVERLLGTYRLETLNLRQCGIEDEAIEALRGRYPHCWIWPRPA